MANQEQYYAHQFIDAIPGSGGIVSKIAGRVGCAWHTAKKYIDTYPTIAKAYRDECERVLDLAESVVIKKITEEDEQTAKWYLTMKGSNRGYAATQRQDSRSLNIDLSGLSVEQLKRIADGEDPIRVLATTG